MSHFTLHERKAFIGGIKIKILRLGNYPGLSTGAQYNHQGPYKKKKLAGGDLISWTSSWHDYYLMTM